MKNALLDVLKSRLIWYAVLACLLFCLGIYFYTQWDIARFEAEMPAVPHRPTSERKAKSPAAIANPNKPTETQDGHFHEDGTWHAGPHATADAEQSEPRSNADLVQLSDEEKAAQEKARLEFYESLGLEPPPPGYRYAKIGDGAPELVKYKDPIIKVAWGEGYGNYHQLTDDELARYSCLRAIDNPHVQKRYRLSPEEVELGLAWEQELYEKTFGPRPTINAFVSRRGSDPQTPEEERALLQRMRDLERDLLPPPPESFPIDYDVFDQIIAEIRTTRQRR